MNVLLAGGGTGGHLMPALAIAAALRELRSDVQPVLVGALRGVESEILPQREFRYHLLPAEPIHRRAWWRNARWPFLLPRLLGRCREVLQRERPVFVVGTGGYAAGPILHMAVRRGIPLALQEQNAYPGFTTRRLAPRAQQIHLGFPEARARIRCGPNAAVYEFGNPIVPPSGRTRDEARRALGLPADVPVTLVMGGSQGAGAINHAVANALADAAFGEMTLLWSTGHGTYEQFRAFAKLNRVLVRPFWDPIGDAYAAADLVVARAGAMTTAELAAWGLPSILIPLPSAAADHQTANARALEMAGAATHLPEAALSAVVLAERVRALLGERDRLARMAEAARRRGRPDAARAIAERLLLLVP